MLNFVTWNHVFHDKLIFLFTLNCLIIYIYLFSPGHLFISNLCHGFVGLKPFIHMNPYSQFVKMSVILLVMWLRKSFKKIFKSRVRRNLFCVLAYGKDEEISKHIANFLLKIFLEEKRGIWQGTDRIINNSLFNLYGNVVTMKLWILGQFH